VIKYLIKKEEEEEIENFLFTYRTKNLRDKTKQTKLAFFT
jgi:hypothetical protein